MRTFAEDLEFFVKSIDFIDDVFFKDIMRLIRRYVRKRWKIEIVKIIRIKHIIKDDNYQKQDNKNQQEQNSKDKKCKEDIYEMVLERFSLGSKLDKEKAISIEYEGQMPFIVKERKPAWITCEDKDSTLTECNEKKYRDWWSNIKNLPKYKKPNQIFKAKTSIIIPYFKDEDNDNILGVVNFESTKYLKCDGESRRELVKLSQVISELIYLNHIYHSNTRNTEKVIDKLDMGLIDNIYNMERETIFLAYPQNSDKEVIKIIKEVVEELNKDLGIDVGIIDWQELSKPEYITPNLFSAIYNSKYGICYISEDINKNKQRFKDNQNVILEAGFMHSKYHSTQSRGSRWILIREENSDKIMFDLSDIRRVKVKRDEIKIDKKTFKEDLKKSLEEMYDL